MASSRTTSATPATVLLAFALCLFAVCVSAQLPPIPKLPGLPTLPNITGLPTLPNISGLSTICLKLLPDVIKCSAFITNPKGSFPVECCNSMTNLISMSLTQANRQATCTCVKSIGSALQKSNPGINVFPMAFANFADIDCQRVL